MRGLACDDCVVTFVLSGNGALDPEERRALGVLADSGLVPPLRLVPVVDPTSRAAPAPSRGPRRRGG